MTYTIDDLLYLMARLRDPVDGCPWDCEQSFESIVPHSIEEIYELVDAIEHNDLPHIKEELGDVLFQVIFYSQLGHEQEAFDFTSVVSALVEKLIRRHPHVFPNGDLKGRMRDQSIDKDSVKQRWEAIKSTERTKKQQESALDDIPLALPAMTRAVKLQKRASRVGFDWDTVEGVLEKLAEEIEEFKEAKDSQQHEAMSAELGDVLFCIGNLARHLRIDPEAALRSSNQRFEQRFRYIEKQLKTQNKRPENTSLMEMDELWDEAKESGL